MNYKYENQTFILRETDILPAHEDHTRILQESYTHFAIHEDDISTLIMEPYTDPNYKNLQKMRKNRRISVSTRMSDIKDKYSCVFPLKCGIPSRASELSQLPKDIYFKPVINSSISAISVSFTEISTMIVRIIFLPKFLLTNQSATHLSGNPLRKQSFVVNSRTNTAVTQN